MVTDKNQTGLEVPPGAIANQIRTLLKERYERYKEGFPLTKEIFRTRMMQVQITY